MTDFTRIGLIRRARAIRKEIDQILTDQEHWNAARPESPPINVDSDGKLRAVILALDAMLAREQEPTP